MNLLRRMALIGLAAALLGTPVLASESKTSVRPEVIEGLEVLNVPLPVGRNGKLINYLYVSTKLMPAPKRDIWKMRESTHFLREGMLLAGHRADFSDPANPEKIDTKRLTAMIAAEAAKVYGAGAIAKVEITSVDSKRTGIAKRYAPTVTAAAQPLELSGSSGIASGLH
jgi:hypothetical protein